MTIVTRALTMDKAPGLFLSMKNSPQALTSQAWKSH